MLKASHLNNLILYTSSLLFSWASLTSAWHIQFARSLILFALWTTCKENLPSRNLAMSCHPHPTPLPMFPGPLVRTQGVCLHFPQSPKDPPPTDGTPHAAVWSSLALSHIPHQSSDYLGGPGSSPGSLSNCWCLAPWQPPKLPHVWELCWKGEETGLGSASGCTGNSSKSKEVLQRLPGYPATRHASSECILWQQCHL